MNDFSDDEIAIKLMATYPADVQRAWWDETLSAQAKRGPFGPPQAVQCWAFVQEVLAGSTVIRLPTEADDEMLRLAPGDLASGLDVMLGAGYARLVYGGWQLT